MFISKTFLISIFTFITFSHSYRLEDDAYDLNPRDLDLGDNFDFDYYPRDASAEPEAEPEADPEAELDDELDIFPLRKSHPSPHQARLAPKPHH